ncbi:hypothetical protein EYZ11_013376 [Aspergillus tanneri]|uniref:Uncharacterized protein n=1 Tax=Aspergillus tanneri TaxID=1220188 RepID=A0A4S3IXT7_9EURO|nr:hypothetical protein EYZ11_013376 [Aspergillus tanneri]
MANYPLEPYEFEHLPNQASLNYH